MKTGVFKFLLSISFLTLGAGCNKQDNGDPEPTPEPQWPSDDTRVVKSGLNFPWEILWGKDNHIWMTERGGKISKIDPLNGNTVFSFDLPDVVSQGEGGLLGMVQHPDFLNNGQFFVVYNYQNTSNGWYTEKVVRYTYANDAATSPVTIIDNIPAQAIHNGSRLFISNEASPKLYISTGDAASPEVAQDINSKAGKILRVNLDGTIPADNPVPGNPYWSLGHRNPQGMVMVGPRLFVSEHGSNIEDEINLIERGRNFGWPNVSGPCDNQTETALCANFNVKEPIWSTGNQTLAVCGLDYYNADRIPQWKNSLLLATLKNATLYQLQLDNNGQSIISAKQYFRGNWGRLRDICISPAGRVYICTSNGGYSDRLIEIQKPE